MKNKKGYHDEKTQRIHICLYPSELRLIDSAIKQTSFRNRSQFIIYHSRQAAKKVMRHV